MDLTENQISPLFTLPSELINHILGFLSLPDLLTLACVNHTLAEHSQQDILWQPFVQSQVAGHVPKPTHLTWRELFKQHHPYWFLAKNKIWFADTAHTGKLIIARYDHRINAIEAYSLVAERGHPSFQSWSWNPDAVIHTFDPKVQLDLNAPIVRLNANAYEASTSTPGYRVQKEMPMDIYHETPLASAGLFSRFMLTRPWPENITTQATPVWPPLSLPSPARTRNDSSPSGFRHTASKPATINELSTSTFRVRKWMEFSSRSHGVSMRIGEDITTYATLPGDCYTPTPQKPWQGIWCGDYAGHGCEFLLVTQPDNPNPLPERADWAMRARERGGSVSSAGSWSTAPSGTSFSGDEEEFSDANDLEDSVATLQGAFASGSGSEEDVMTGDEDSVYHGRIEAIKLTGDPNIPRGEYTFIAPEIGPSGLIRIATEDIFKGARIVKSVGHIAARGFRDGKRRHCPCDRMLTQDR
jgi:hypothetical protein